MFRPTSHTLLIGALALTSFSTAYFPQASEARPSTRAYTCGGVRNYVRKRGAVVMNTKSSSIYRRFVAHRGYCTLRESLRRFRVPTKSGRCSLYICYEYDFDEFGRF